MDYKVSRREHQLTLAVSSAFIPAWHQWTHGDHVDRVAHNVDGILWTRNREIRDTGDAGPYRNQ